MQQADIIYPMAALALLTLAILAIAPYRRIKVAFAGRVNARNFKYGESANGPPDVGIPNRNMMNLLDLAIWIHGFTYCSRYERGRYGQAQISLSDGLCGRKRRSLPE